MSSNVLHAPRKLEKSDSRELFTSGADELDDWLRKYAWQNQRANNAVTYVALLGDQVVGYYAIASAGVAKVDVDSTFARSRPDPIPCILLARLAVDQRVQGRGVGAALLADALFRALAVSEGLGAACMLVHCRDESAKAFYMRQIDAQVSPIDNLKLVIPMKAIRNYVEA